MEKFNIAELLKDCPKGMEVDCTTWQNVTFEKVRDDNIFIRRNNKQPQHDSIVVLNEYGCVTNYEDEKCVIFPKGKTTWEGFQRPFKDGDIVYVKSNRRNEYIIIFKEIKNDYIHRYACVSYQHFYIDKCALCLLVNAEIMRLATEEEKQRLFDAIKANGYKWNADTKTLEKLPKFKVGDRIKEGKKIAIVERVYKNSYDIRFDIDGGIGAFTIDLQDNWELVPNKFDISTLKPFDKVLYRMHHNDTWLAGFYNVCIKNKIFVIGLPAVPYCIPYENNQHLLGTTNDCDEYYKTWENNN